MKVLTVEKPIKGKKTGIGQAFDELMKDLPINSWCLKNKK